MSLPELPYSVKQQLKNLPQPPAQSGSSQSDAAHMKQEIAQQAAPPPKCPGPKPRASWPKGEPKAKRPICERTGSFTELVPRQFFLRVHTLFRIKKKKKKKK
eukprot:889998_1